MFFYSTEYMYGETKFRRTEILNFTTERFISIRSQFLEEYSNMQL